MIMINAFKYIHQSSSFFNTMAFLWHLSESIFSTQLSTHNLQHNNWKLCTYTHTKVETFKSFTKAYCLLLDATDIWEYKYKWHPRPHSDDAILPKSNADDGLPPHWRERRLKIYHACPSPTSPHTKLSSCCINSNWNKKLMVLLEFSVK